MPRPRLPSSSSKRARGCLSGRPRTRRGASYLARLAREFKRRFGDPTPLILGGSPFAADALTAKILRWVVDCGRGAGGRSCRQRDRVASSELGSIQKRDLLQQSLRRAGLTEAETITEPEAAAIYYASNERVESGTIVAVYDLGLVAHSTPLCCAKWRRASRSWGDLRGSNIWGGSTSIKRSSPESTGPRTAR